MLLSKEVEVTITSKNYKRYQDMGYDFDTKINRGKTVIPKGTKCVIKIEDLDRKSSAVVRYRCDYCGVEKDVCYKDYMKHYPEGTIKEKDACLKCSSKKSNEILKNKYGVENAMHLDFVKEKVKETNIKRYGVECTLNTEENRKKIKSGFIKKYNVPYYSMTNECKEKVKATNKEKYGVEYYSMTSEWKKNFKNTSLKRYGVSNISKAKEIKIKKAETFYKNSTIATSRQQLYLHKLLGGELNYSNNTPSLDIAFPDEKIYIEFNGSGHDLCVKLGNMTREEFENRERARYFYLRDRGWKCIIINSSRDYLPSDEIILNEFNKAKDWFKSEKSGHRHYIINIGDLIQDENYGKLRKIKEEDLETA